MSIGPTDGWYQYIIDGVHSYFPGTEGVRKCAEDIDAFTLPLSKIIVLFPSLFEDYPANIASIDPDTREGTSVETYVNQELILSHEMQHFWLMTLRPATLVYSHHSN